MVLIEFRDFDGIFNEILMISELFSMVLIEFRDFYEIFNEILMHFDHLLDDYD